MKHSLFLLVLILMATSCSNWHPVEQRTAEQKPSPRHGGSGVTATFLGNTTILISDGRTRLLVDGFLSRPDSFQTLFGRIGPDEVELEKRLNEAKIDKLDAVLVAHAHHDHALDAPWVSRRTRAIAYGSKSYAYVHLGHLGPDGKDNLKIVADDGGAFKIGDFVVTFVPSEHVSAHFPPQHLVEDSVTRYVGSRAWFHEYKCGPIFALHIQHRGESLAITTSAGARKGQFSGLKADVVFLGVGLIAKECGDKQELYWKETVKELEARVVVPVHWDNFSKKIGAGSRKLSPMPRLLDNTRGAFDWVERNASGRQVIILDYRESLRIRNGRIR